MFFHLSATADSKCKFGSMFEFLIDGTVLQLDRGWVQTETGDTIDFRKGYSIESSLSDIEAHTSTVGNYCIIQYSKVLKHWSIHVDTLRGFPIYYNKSVITNLKTDLKSLHPDRWPYMHNGDISLWGPYNKYKLPKKESLPLDEIIDRVEFELLDYIEKFIKYNNDEITLNPTFGYDCTALKAILDFNNIPYIYTDPIQCGTKLPPLSNDEVFLSAFDTQWGYAQLGITDKPQTLLTGFCGDEYLMRGPLYVYYYLKQYGIDYEYEALSCQSHSRLFIEERYIQKNKFSEGSKNKPTNDQLANALLTDYQMWGVDTTTTIVPYKNINILELSFRLKPEDALEQGLNAIIQHRIIKKCNPALLATISPNKATILPIAE